MNGAGVSLLAVPPPWHCFLPDRQDLRSLQGGSLPCPEGHRGLREQCRGPGACRVECRPQEAGFGGVLGRGTRECQGQVSELWDGSGLPWEWVRRLQGGRVCALLRLVSSYLGASRASPEDGLYPPHPRFMPRVPSLQAGRTPRPRNGSEHRLGSPGEAQGTAAESRPRAEAEFTVEKLF